MEVAVTANGDGSFAASGRNAAGTPFTFQIQVKPELNELSCLRITGDPSTPDGRSVKSF